MEEIKTFSIARNNDFEVYKTFDKIRNAMQMKRSEAILKAMEEFNINHPLKFVLGQITDFIDNKPKTNLPTLLYMDINQLKDLCKRTDTKTLMQYKEKVAKMLTVLELEAQDRFE